MSEISKVGVIEADYTNVVSKVKEVLDLIGYKPEKKKILLKPNIVSPRDKDSPVITNPKVIEALIIYFKEFADEIVIGEGSVAGTPSTLCFKAASYEELAKKHDVKLLDFNECERVPVEWEFGTLMIPKILETHEYVNVAKMKTHIQTTASLAMKNQKGILSPADKKIFHKSGKLIDRIKELNEVVKPDLNVMDAIACIEGNGPGAEGNTVILNRIMASEDILAMDNAALEIMGIPVDKVKYMTKKEFEIVGFKGVPKKFRLPDEYYSRMNLRMWFNDSCSGCNINIFKSIKGLKKHPFQAIKFLYNITVNKTNVVAGPKHDKMPKEGRIICVGNCTKAIAEREGYTFIAGCPPECKKIREKL